MLLFFCFPFAFFSFCFGIFAFMFYMPFLLLFFGYLCFSVLYIFFLLPFWCFFCIFGFLCSERARGRLRSNRDRFKTKALPHPSSLEEGGFAYHFSWGFPFLMDTSFLLFSLCLFFLLFRYLCFYVLYALFIAFFFGYLCFSVLYISFLLPFCCFFCIFGFLFYVSFLAGGRLRKGQRKVDKQQR